MSLARALRMLGLLSWPLGSMACGGTQPLDAMPPGRRIMPVIREPDYVVPASAKEALRGPLGILPSIAILSRPRDADGNPRTAHYTINGFPADGYGCAHATEGQGSIAGIELLCPIHPYFLLRGENRVHVDGDGFKMAVNRWDYLHSKSHDEIAKLGPRSDETFTLDMAIPEWPWAHSPTIAESAENTRSLKAEVDAFHEALAAMAPAAKGTAESSQKLSDQLRATTAAFIRASELRGKPFTFLSDLVAAARGLPFGNRPADSVILMPVPTNYRLEIFAGGHLARLAAEYDAPVIAFNSTYDDGQWGSKGGTKIACDLWYRKDSADHWILDAIVPVQSTTIARHYETAQLGDIYLTNLFQHTAF